LELFFKALAECDPALASWYEKGRSRKAALAKPAAVDDRNYLLNLLERGRHRRDTDRSVIEELGFSCELWNGANDDHAISVSVGCGLYYVSPSADTGMDNTVNLDLAAGLGMLRDPDRMAAVLAAVADAWEPQSGFVTAEAPWEEDESGDDPFVDWMVYVSYPVGKIVPPSRVLATAHGGSIIIVQPEPPSRASREDVSRIKAVERAIRGGRRT
jgi:Immunity protein 52